MGRETAQLYFFKAAAFDAYTAITRRQSACATIAEPVCKAALLGRLLWRLERFNGIPAYAVGVICVYRSALITAARELK